MVLLILITGSVCFDEEMTSVDYYALSQNLVNNEQRMKYNL